MQVFMWNLIMKTTTIIFILIMSFTLLSQDSFKEGQKNQSRVKQAYIDKESIIISLLSENLIDIKKLRIYLRAFKAEKKIELWAKNQADTQYTLIKEYDICKTCGNPGPKREEGDYQIPEGFYHIDRFNPNSKFYLSLGLNYPNKSDRILGVKGSLGSDIFIHGSCVTNRRKEYTTL